MRRGLGFVVATLAALVLVAVPANAAVKTTKKIKLSASERADAPRELDIRVKTPWRSSVRIEELAEGDWRQVASGRPKKRRLALTATAPSGVEAVVLRASVPKRKAVSRRVTVALQPTLEPEPNPPVEVIPQGMPVGFNNNAVSQGVASADQSAELLAGVGASIDRVQVNWERFERTPGNYDFALSDAIYAADRARGIRPLFILAYAPRWASGTACAGVVGRCLAGPQPDYYDDYGRAAAALAARYPEAAGIEIWNEPNLKHFWQPGADPEAYAALLREAFAAIRQANPNIAVAGGSVVQGGSPGPGEVPGVEFLGRVYAAGAASAMDALTLHPYPGVDATGDRAVRFATDIRAVRDTYGDPSKPLWVTETGATTTGVYALGELDQATRLTLLDTRLRATAGVEMFIVHTLIDPPVDAASPEAGFGVVRSDLSKKPAYCALALSWAGSAAC